MWFGPYSSFGSKQSKLKMLHTFQQINCILYILNFDHFKLKKNFYANNVRLQDSNGGWKNHRQNKTTFFQTGSGVLLCHFPAAIRFDAVLPALPTVFFRTFRPFTEMNFRANRVPARVIYTKFPRSVTTLCNLLRCWDCHHSKHLYLCIQQNCKGQLKHKLMIILGAESSYISRCLLTNHQLYSKLRLWNTVHTGAAIIDVWMALWFQIFIQGRYNTIRGPLEIPAKSLFSGLCSKDKKWKLSFLVCAHQNFRIIKISKTLRTILTALQTLNKMLCLLWDPTTAVPPTVSGKPPAWCSSSLM